MMQPVVFKKEKGATQSSADELLVHITASPVEGTATMALVIGGKPHKEAHELLAQAGPNDDVSIAAAYVGQHDREGCRHGVGILAIRPPMGAGALATLTSPTSGPELPAMPLGLMPSELTTPSTAAAALVAANANNNANSNNNGLSPDGVFNSRTERNKAIAVGGDTAFLCQWDKDLPILSAADAADMSLGTNERQQRSSNVSAALPVVLVHGGTRQRMSAPTAALLPYRAGEERAADDDNEKARGGELRAFVPTGLYIGEASLLSGGPTTRGKLQGLEWAHRRLRVLPHGVGLSMSTNPDTMTVKGNEAEGGSSVKSPTLLTAKQPRGGASSARRPLSQHQGFSRASMAAADAPCYLGEFELGERTGFGVEIDFSAAPTHKPGGGGGITTDTLISGSNPENALSGELGACGDCPNCISSRGAPPLCDLSLPSRVLPSYEQHPIGYLGPYHTDARDGSGMLYRYGGGAGAYGGGGPPPPIVIAGLWKDGQMVTQPPPTTGGSTARQLAHNVDVTLLRTSHRLVGSGWELDKHSISFKAMTMICPKGGAAQQRHTDGIWEALLGQLDQHLSNTTMTLADEEETEQGGGGFEHHHRAGTEQEEEEELTSAHGQSKPTLGGVRTFAVVTPRSRLWRALAKAVRKEAFTSLLTTFQEMFNKLHMGQHELPWCESSLNDVFITSTRRLVDYRQSMSGAAHLSSHYPSQSTRRGGGESFLGAVDDDATHRAAAALSAVGAFVPQVEAEILFAPKAAAIPSSIPCVKHFQGAPSLPALAPQVPTVASFLRACDDLASFVVSLRFRLMSLVAAANIQSQLSGPMIKCARDAMEALRILEETHRSNVVSSNKRKGGESTLLFEILTGPDSARGTAGRGVSGTTAGKILCELNASSCTAPRPLVAALGHQRIAAIASTLHAAATLASSKKTRSGSPNSSSRFWSTDLEYSDEVLHFAWDLLYPMCSPALESLAASTYEVRCWVTDVELAAQRLQLVGGTNEQPKKPPSNKRRTTTRENNEKSNPIKLKGDPAVLALLPYAMRSLIVYEDNLETIASHIVTKASLSRAEEAEESAHEKTPPLSRLQSCVRDFAEVFFTVSGGVNSQRQTHSAKEIANASVGTRVSVVSSSLLSSLHSERKKAEKGRGRSDSSSSGTSLARTASASRPNSRTTSPGASYVLGESVNSSSGGAPNLGSSLDTLSVESYPLFLNRAKRKSRKASRDVDEDGSADVPAHSLSRCLSVLEQLRAAVIEESLAQSQKLLAKCRAMRSSTKPKERADHHQQPSSCSQVKSSDNREELEGNTFKSEDPQKSPTAQRDFSKQRSQSVFHHGPSSTTNPDEAALTQQLLLERQFTEGLSQAVLPLLLLRLARDGLVDGTHSRMRKKESAPNLRQSVESTRCRIRRMISKLVVIDQVTRKGIQPSTQGEGAGMAHMVRVGLMVKEDEGQDSEKNKKETTGNYETSKDNSSLESNAAAAAIAASTPRKGAVDGHNSKKKNTTYLGRVEFDEQCSFSVVACFMEALEVCRGRSETLSSAMRVPIATVSASYTHRQLYHSKKGTMSSDLLDRVLTNFASLSHTHDSSCRDTSPSSGGVSSSPRPAHLRRQSNPLLRVPEFACAPPPFFISRPADTRAFTTAANLSDTIPTANSTPQILTWRLADWIATGKPANVTSGCKTHKPTITSDGDHLKKRVALLSLLPPTIPSAAAAAGHGEPSMDFTEVKSAADGTLPAQNMLDSAAKDKVHKRKSNGSTTAFQISVATSHTQQAPAGGEDLTRLSQHSITDTTLWLAASAASALTVRNRNFTTMAPAPNASSIEEIETDVSRSLRVSVKTIGNDFDSMLVPSSKQGRIQGGGDLSPVVTTKTTLTTPTTSTNFSSSPQGSPRGTMRAADNLSLYRPLASEGFALRASDSYLKPLLATEISTESVATRIDDVTIQQNTASCSEDEKRKGYLDTLVVVQLPAYAITTKDVLAEGSSNNINNNGGDGSQNNTKARGVVSCTRVSTLANPNASHIHAACRVLGSLGGIDISLDDQSAKLLRLRKRNLVLKHSAACEFHPTEGSNGNGEVNKETAKNDINTVTPPFNSSRQPSPCAQRPEEGANDHCEASSSPSLFLVGSSVSSVAASPSPPAKRSVPLPMPKVTMKSKAQAAFFGSSSSSSEEEDRRRPHSFHLRLSSNTLRGTKQKLPSTSSSSPSRNNRPAKERSSSSGNSSRSRSSSSSSVGEDLMRAGSRLSTGFMQSRATGILQSNPSFSVGGSGGSMAGIPYGGAMGGPNRYYVMSAAVSDAAEEELTHQKNTSKKQTANERRRLSRYSQKILETELLAAIHLENGNRSRVM